MTALLSGCNSGSSFSDGPKYFEKGCRVPYSETKGKDVFQLSVVTLAAGGATLLGLILYGIIYQRRAHAGYAGVSRG